MRLANGILSKGRGKGETDGRESWWRDRGQMETREKRTESQAANEMIDKQASLQNIRIEKWVDGLSADHRITD